MLTDGLTEGCHSDSVTDSLKHVPGHRDQQHASGDSAEAPMEVDADVAQLTDRCIFPPRMEQSMHLRHLSVHTPRNASCVVSVHIGAYDQV